MHPSEDFSYNLNILRSLVIKQLFGKYWDSKLGFLWHFFKPLLMLAVYYIAFSVRGQQLDNYWVYLASGLFIFHFMLDSFVSGATVMVNNSGIIKKMYFPRIIIPLSFIISSFIIMVIGYIVVFIIMIISGFQLNLNVAMFPLILLLAAVFSTGCILFLSSISVYVRDLHYFINSITMVFFFLTPIYFVVDNAGELLKNIVMLNPFSYYIEASHYLIYWGEMVNLNILGMCIVLALIVFIIGFIVFNKLEGKFAEKL